MLCGFSILRSSIFFGGAGLAGNVSVLAVLAYGSKLIEMGELSTGQLTSFLMY